MNAADNHNALAAAFVRSVGGGTSNTSQIAVVLESIILGSMRLMSGLYGAAPQVAAGLVEAAVQRAIERFADGEKP